MKTHILRNTNGRWRQVYCGKAAHQTVEPDDALRRANSDDSICRACLRGLHTARGTRPEEWSLRRAADGRTAQKGPCLATCNAEELVVIDPTLGEYPIPRTVVLWLIEALEDQQAPKRRRVARKGKR